MTDTKTKWVTFTPEMIEECEEFCERLTAHYRNNGDRRTAMPWTRDQFTNNELPLWLASRKVAGKQIDIESCEIGWWYVNDADVYGIREELNEPPSEEESQYGRCRFVRSPQSDGWVSEYDLPPEKQDALYARLERQHRH
jgi:hypothetical protein